MKTNIKTNGALCNFTVLLALASLIGLNLGHAQETGTNAGASSLSDLEVMEQLIESTTPVPASELPDGGTFWSAQHSPASAFPWPPLPSNFGHPAWSLGDGIFLLDDTNVDYAESAQLQSANGVQAMDEGFGGGFAPGFSFPTNSLWLQMNAMSNGLVYLTLNNATDQVYEIWSKTDLTATNWNIEPNEVWPTNASAMPFTVSVLDRINTLFIWSRDWTGITSNGNETPDWWFWKYFGTLDLSDTNLDSEGNTLLSDYQSDVDPNIIQFSLQFTNTYLNTMTAYGSLTIAGGTPFYEAILVNDTNTADAVWGPYAGTNLAVSLTFGDGVYNVQVGLRGLPDDAAQTWLGARLILDTVPPVITITNPVAVILGQPMIQLQGYANESLDSLTFDVSNVMGIFTNQTGYVTGQIYDTNLLIFTTNYFQCYDIRLTDGLNTITLHATDLAGNITTTNVSFTLDYSSVTNPPALTVVWPQNGAQISGSNFTLQAQVDDATALVTASITDTNGNTTVVPALVERDGTVWANNLPLAAGTSLVTLMATNAAGLGSVTNFNVVDNDVGLTVNPLTADQLNQQYVTVTGTIGNSGDNVTVNGVPANVSSDLTWEADNVPVSSIRTAGLDVEVSDTGNNPLAGLRVNQTQPVTVVPMSYASTYHKVFTGVSEGSGYEDYYYNWSYVLGGNDYGDDVLFNGGEDDHDNHWNNPLPGGVGALSTIAKNGSMAGTFNNVIFYVFGLFGAYGTFEYQAQSETMIEPVGQQTAGGMALYLVEASAMGYTNVTDALNGNSGEVPVEPQTLAINGQALMNSGITNTDGSVQGMTLISAPAGAPVKLTTTAPANLYSFTNNQVQEVTVQLLTVVSNSATQINSNNWAAVKSNATNDYVIVQATLSVTNEALLANATIPIQWNCGEAVPGNPLQCRISKATSAETTVTATLGSSSTSLNVWVIWSTVQTIVSGSNPSPLSFASTDFPNNQLGIETNADQDEAAGKICTVATITPTGIHALITNQLVFLQSATRHSFQNAMPTTPWFDTWTNDPTLTTSIPDSNDKLYLIDAPNITDFGGTNDEKYMNFCDYVTWNSQICGDTNNFWHWQGRWNGNQYPPPFITYTSLGIGTNTLPATAFY